jgi:L-asparaginase/Glu-tRNA(Gln) amidotransferase subunit D
MGQYETSTGLKAVGVIWKDITTEAAITKLMYLLSQNNAKKTLKLFLKLLYEAKYYNNVILLF